MSEPVDLDEIEAIIDGIEYNAERVALSALVAEVRALRVEVQQWRGWTQEALDRADSARASLTNVRMLRDRWSYLTTAMALPDDREFLESVIASLDEALSAAEPADQPSEAGA